MVLYVSGIYYSYHEMVLIWVKMPHHNLTHVLFGTLNQAVKQEGSCLINSSKQSNTYCLQIMERRIKSSPLDYIVIVILVLWILLVGAYLCLFYVRVLSWLWQYCRRCSVTVGKRVPTAPLDWYYFSNRENTFLLKVRSF